MSTAKPPPLKPEVFEILLRLIESDCHGYAIMGDIAERTQGEVNMLPGALYRHLGRLLDAGFIKELDRRDGGGNDERRRYYGITPNGREAAAVEASRLVRMVEAARAHDLLNEEN